MVIFLKAGKINPCFMNKHGANFTRELLSNLAIYSNVVLGIIANQAIEFSRRILQYVRDAFEFKPFFPGRKQPP